jgi:multicomponent Na+:H+ antiporter subunit E
LKYVQLLALNLLFAIFWLLMWGGFHIYALIMGLLVGYVVIALISRAIEPASPAGLPAPAPARPSYAARPWQLLSFAIFFVRILVQSNIQVAREVVTPGLTMSPRILRVDASDMSPSQVTFFASTITLTPGTLSVDVTDRGDALYVHAMYAADRDRQLADLETLKRRILKEVFAC